MRSKFWILLICFHCLAVGALAQNPAKRQLVLQLANGGFIGFTSEVSGNKTSGGSLAALLYAQAFAGENRIIHRVLTDAEQNVVFGYDLWVSADPLTKKFSVVVLPADEAFRRSFLKGFNGSFATFPKSTTPQTLDDGDAVSLELLVNHESGAKIVDVVKVTFDRTTLRESNLESAPKDFTLDAVALGVKHYSLLLNGNEVSKSKSNIGSLARCCGSTFRSAAVSSFRSCRAQATTSRRSPCLTKTRSHSRSTANATNGFRVIRSCRTAVPGISGCCATRNTLRCSAPRIHNRAPHRNRAVCLASLKTYSRARARS